MIHSLLFWKRIECDWLPFGGDLAAARSGAPFELTALMSPGHDVFSCYHFLRKETCLVYLNGRTYVFQMCSVLMSLLSLRICSSVAVKIIICNFFLLSWSVVDEWVSWRFIKPELIWHLSNGVWHHLHHVADVPDLQIETCFSFGVTVTLDVTVFMPQTWQLLTGG